MLAGAGSRHCPEHRALKARPSVWPVTPFVDRRYPKYVTFLIGVVRDAILAVERGDVPAADMEPWSSVSPRAVAHVITHGASHRGAIGKMLEGLGLPGASDMVTTFRHTRA